MAHNLSTQRSWRSWLGVFSLGLLLVLNCTQERFKGVDPVDVGRGRPDRVLVLLKDGTSLELRDLQLGTILLWDAEMAVRQKLLLGTLLRFRFRFDASAQLLHLDS